MALDLHIVMPDHVHGIIVIEHAPASTAGGHGGCHVGAPIPGALGTVVRSFKAAATAHTRAMRSNTDSPLWQRGYYEHIVRNDRDLDRIRQYIDENPLRWHLRRQAGAVTR